ncbi:MAG: periplasmic heavy metal sensor [Hyphomicrobiaceae bacterium]|nr:periplasmic heavy metal sensor [Hyphomicrobiaceae bacterium]
MTANGNDASRAGTPRRRRWIWLVLIVSVGLNLLFVGLVAGRMWARLDGPPGAPHRIVTRAVEKFSAKLPASKKQRANSLLKKQREDNRSLRREFREARRAAKEAALATTYDEKRLADALARLRDVRTSQYQAMHAMVLELLKDLTLEERKILLRYIQKASRPHRHADHPGNRRKNGERRREQ